MKGRSGRSIRRQAVAGDRAAESVRPEGAGTALSDDPAPDRYYPGTAVSCTPVIMKKVRVMPVVAKGTKRSFR
jgi:hypothetical protein